METHSYKVCVGKFQDHYLELESMFIEHWEEVAKNKHLMILKPDYKTYLEVERTGNLLSLYAYHNDKLVGYSYNFLRYHIHYADLYVSFNDALYVHPDHRNSSLGIKLIKETEKESKLRGAKLMLWHSKENTALSSILARMDCKVQEIIFSKEL